MRLRHAWLATLLALALPAAAPAAPMTLALTPGNMLAELHSSGLMMDMTARFRQFSGTLSFDPQAESCHVDIIFVVKSLQFPTALVRSQALAPSFLDPARYPQQHYVGDCDGGQLLGVLTMHGQTHPFDMALTRTSKGGVLTGLHLAGRINRYDWGLTGLSMTMARMLRFTTDIALDGQTPPAK